MEIFRNKFLKTSKGNYDYPISLTKEIIEDVRWWIKNVDNYPNTIGIPEFSLEIYTDACLTGYGIFCEGKQTNGLWNESEKQFHINALELLAIKIGLLCFCAEIKNKHIHVFTDNTVSVLGINKMGSCKENINNIIRDIWLFCMERNIKITASHIPGVKNVIADKLSRSHKIDLEWKLNPKIFDKLKKILGPFDIDLFSSRINFQMKPYASWNPDPEASFINALNMTWTKIFGYAFPPFSLIPRILQKIEMEKVENLCILVPLWKTQSWFPKLGRLLIDLPILIPNRKDVLIHPLEKSRSHPLSKKLNLMACKLSGIDWKQREFRERQLRSLFPRRDQERQNNTTPTSNNSYFFVVKGIQIPVRPLRTL